MMPVSVEKRLGKLARGYEEFVKGMPEPLIGQARALAKVLAPGSKDLVEHYGAKEAYPLLRVPLWLEDRYVSRGVLTGSEGYGTSSAYASLLGYLYIRIQDNVLDEPEQFDSAYLLLGNEYVREFFSTYHALFAHGSPFWGYMKKYWLATTNNTLWERLVCGGKIKEFDGGDLARAGGKLDGGKVAIASMCILAGREPDIARYGPVMDDLNIASQLHNDAVSVVKDQKHDYFTCLIASTVGSGEGAEAGRDILWEASIKALTGSHLEDWLGAAEQYNTKALGRLAPGELPGLDQYVKAKNAHLAELRKDILDIKRELLSI
jgi:hypothetical protein